MAGLIGAGLNNQAIAVRLGISIDTVKRHSSRIRQKLQLQSTTALACHFLGRAPLSFSDLHFLSTELSKTERHVALLLCAGATSKHIARAIEVSSRTVEKHRENILRKCAVHSSRELVAWIAAEYVKGGIADGLANP